MARWHRLGLSMLVWACAAVGARAQEVFMPPSAALACMTPPLAERGQPAYPAIQLERKDGATVRVELVFDGPDMAPALRLLDDFYVQDDFVESVRAHVRRFRVPCMPAGAEAVRVAQTYVFTPGDGRKVVGLPPRDLSLAREAALAKCLTRITPGSRPEYPTMAERFGDQGNFLVRLRFTGPNEPPEPEFVAGPKHRWFRESVATFVAGFRLPCHEGAPASLDLLFHFQIDGGPRTRLKDMTLRQFVGLARTTPPARFDLRTMGCPFDLQVLHRQPFAAHRVGQLGEARAERADFIAWMSQVQFNLDESTALEVLGDTFTVHVPCATLDL